MYDYADYIKCGEILLSPSVTNKDQYILKCSDCEEYYCELETFVPHWVSHYRENSDESESESQVQYENDSKDYVTIKSEGITNEDDGTDPLTYANQEYKSENEESDDEDKPTLDDSEINRNYAHEDADEFLDEEQSSEYQDGNCSENTESDNESMESEDSKLSTFIRNFMESEIYVTTFISAYKDQPHLWDSELSSHVRAKQRPTYLQQIASELNEQINVQITITQVSAIIAHLRYKYRNTLKYLKAKENQEDYVKTKDQPVWFFELLNFLPSIENVSIATFNSHQPDLEPKQIIQILIIYERFPHLWNSNLIENCCTNKRLAALEKMQNVIESKMGLQIDENDLKSYINCIHMHCTREKRIEMSNSDKPEYRSEYYKYMLFLHDHVAPFKCSECSRTLLNPLKLKVHKSKHDGSIPLECSLCQKGYLTTEPYIAHVRRHMDDLNVECKECGKRFLRTAEMMIHMRCHTGVKPYCCEICGTSFRHSNAFVIHKRRHNKIYLHKCPVCSKGFYAKDEMSVHLDTHKEVRDLLCKICGKGYKTKTTLKAHVLTHEEGRTHSCKLCGKMFKNRIGVYQHMRTHRNKDPELATKSHSVLNCIK